MTTWTPDIMLYHANCADGFAAAWAARQRWQGLACLPASYGKPAPDVTGKNVLIGDFSYKEAELLAMAQTASSIVILDHHKTARDDLKGFQRYADKPERFTPASIGCMIDDLRRGGYEPICAMFDMERSGARLVWDFCFPGEEPPTMIQLIEDRDLWRFAFEETKPFALWLRAEPFDFERWDLIAQDLDEARAGPKIMAEATAMQRFYDQKVSEIASMSRPTRIGGFTVPGCNCPPSFASDVGHALLQKHPNAPFVACYSDQGDARGYSLRSSDEREDVSVIAKKYGGGGHRNAAGFGVPA